jgi:hypothetical protein
MATDYRNTGNTSQYEFIWNPRSASLRIIYGSTLRRLQAQFLNAYSTLTFPPPALQPPIALPIFSRSSAVGSRSRIKPLLEMRLEAFEHLFFYVFDVGEQLPTSDIAVFTGALKLQNEFFH